MALSADDIARIDALMSSPGAASQSIAEMRGLLPGLQLTRCDPSDVDGQVPFRSSQVLSLYLLDGRDHCVQLTTDPARATGLLVVRHGA